MNQSKMERETEKWVMEGIITIDQKNEIVAKYTKKDPSYLLILFAALFISIGVLIIVWADWAQVPNPLRVTIMIGSMVSLYIVGNYFYHKSVKDLTTYPLFFGVSLVLLGYVFFGATTLLLIEIYHVEPLSVWPYALWSAIGLSLCFLYPHRLIYIIALLVTVVGQIMSGTDFNTFHFILFFLFIIGYLYVTYKRNDQLLSYLFAIGFSVQCLVAVQTWLDNYYWLILCFILMYGASVVVNKDTIQRAFFTISIFSIFIYKMFETMAVQEKQFMLELSYEPVFFVFISIAIIGLFVLFILKRTVVKLMDLILFIPLFFLPSAYMYILASMFIFSIYWLINGFQKGKEERRLIGIITFVISSLTVYMQFAWETLNKSLFFIIGGILLFALSFMLEKQKRKREQEANK